MKNIQEIIREILFLPEDEKLKPEDGPGSIEAWDSINHVNIINTLEEELEITFSDDDIVKMENLKTIEEIVKSKTD